MSTASGLPPTRTLASWLADSSNVQDWQEAATINYLLTNHANLHESAARVLTAGQYADLRAGLHARLRMMAADPAMLDLVGTILPLDAPSSTTLPGDWGGRSSSEFHPAILSAISNLAEAAPPRDEPATANRRLRESASADSELAPAFPPPVQGAVFTETDHWTNSWGWANTAPAFTLGDDLPGAGPGRASLEFQAPTAEVPLSRLVELASQGLVSQTTLMSHLQQQQSTETMPFVYWLQYRGSISRREEHILFKTYLALSEINSDLHAYARTDRHTSDEFSDVLAAIRIELDWLAQGTRNESWLAACHVLRRHRPVESARLAHELVSHYEPSLRDAHAGTRTISEWCHCSYANMRHMRENISLERHLLGRYFSRQDLDSDCPEFFARTYRIRQFFEFIAALRTQQTYVTGAGSSADRPPYNGPPAMQRAVRCVISHACLHGLIQPFRPVPPDPDVPPPACVALPAPATRVRDWNRSGERRIR